jgi:hypothetical protein
VNEFYDALPISNDALERGGVELLRAGVVDEELFIMARRVFADPGHWGYVLADVTRRLAALYAAESDFTEANVSTAIAETFARSLRSKAGAAREPSKRPPAKRPPAKGQPAERQPTSTARPHVKTRAKSKPIAKAVARRKGARAKP